MDNLVNFLYQYATDFVINLANLLHISYYEVNAFIFVIIWPLATALLFSIFIYQIAKLLKRKQYKVR